MTPDELNEKLQSLALPQSLQLSKWEYIEDVKIFLAKHFNTVHHAGGNFENSPSWWRLLRFYDAVESGIDKTQDHP